MRIRNRTGSLGESFAGVGYRCWFRDGNVPSHLLIYIVQNILIELHVYIGKGKLRETNSTTLFVYRYRVLFSCANVLVLFYMYLIYLFFF